MKLHISNKSELEEELRSTFDKDNFSVNFNTIINNVETVSSSRDNVILSPFGTNVFISYDSIALPDDMTKGHYNLNYLIHDNPCEDHEAAVECSKRNYPGIISKQLNMVPTDAMARILNAGSETKEDELFRRMLSEYLPTKPRSQFKILEREVFVILYPHQLQEEIGIDVCSTDVDLLFENVESGDLHLVEVKPFIREDTLFRAKMEKKARLQSTLGHHIADKYGKRVMPMEFRYAKNSLGNIYIKQAFLRRHYNPPLLKRDKNG